MGKGFGGSPSGTDTSCLERQWSDCPKRSLSDLPVRRSGASKMLPTRRNGAGPPEAGEWDSRTPFLSDVLVGQTGPHIEASLQTQRENDHAPVTKGTLCDGDHFVF